MTKVELHGHEEELVNRLVSSGRFDDPGQVVALSLHLLEQLEAHQSEIFEGLRKDLLQGNDAFEKGELSDLDVLGIAREARAAYESRRMSS